MSRVKSIETCSGFQSLCCMFQNIPLVFYQLTLLNNTSDTQNLFSYITNYYRENEKVSNYGVIDNSFVRCSVKRFYSHFRSSIMFQVQKLILQNIAWNMPFKNQVMIRHFLHELLSFIKFRGKPFKDKYNKVASESQMIPYSNQDSKPPLFPLVLQFLTLRIKLCGKDKKSER